MARADQRETASQLQQSEPLESRMPQAQSISQSADSQPADSHDDAFDANVTDAERRRMIAEAAYFIAQRRDFDGGLELDDWLAAEAEVNAKLARASAS